MKSGRIIKTLSNGRAEVEVVDIRPWGFKRKEIVYAALDSATKLKPNDLVAIKNRKLGYEIVGPSLEPLAWVAATALVLIAATTAAVIGEWSIDRIGSLTLTGLIWLLFTGRLLAYRSYVGQTRAERV